MKQFLKRIRDWFNSPPLLDQFQSIYGEDVLELTEIYEKPDPFGRFKRMLDAKR